MQSDMPPEEEGGRGAVSKNPAPDFVERCIFRESKLPKEMHTGAQTKQ
jgi:hypothetical protein